MRRDSSSSVVVLSDTGDVRACVLPRDWFGDMVPTADVWATRRLPDGRLVLGIARYDLAALVADTVDQLETGHGTVHEKRVALLRKLCTDEEWADAEQVARLVRVAADAQERERRL